MPTLDLPPTPLNRITIGHVSVWDRKPSSVDDREEVIGRDCGIQHKKGNGGREHRDEPVGEREAMRKVAVIALAVMAGVVLAAA